MLAIRLQRTGRKGHAQFRVIVQDSHRSPSTGKVIEYLGNYNPHSKEISLEKDRIENYLSNGAQPSSRVAFLLKKEGYKLPKWVEVDTSAKKTLKNPEKLRKNQPAKPKEEASAPVKEEEVAEAPAEEPASEVKTEEVKEKTIEPKPEDAKEEASEPGPANEAPKESKEEPRKESKDK